MSSGARQCCEAVLLPADSTEQLKNDWGRVGGANRSRCDLPVIGGSSEKSHFKLLPSALRGVCCVCGFSCPASCLSPLQTKQLSACNGDPAL